MWKMILPDGTELNGLRVNGSNYVSAERIDEAVFADNLSTLTIRDGETETVLRNAELIQQAYYPNADPPGWYLCFRERTAAELRRPALDAAVYMAGLMLAGEAADTDDRRLRASGLYPQWAPGAHRAGEHYNARGQTWACFADYDSAAHPDVAPGNPETWHTFNRPLHGTAPETARPWCRPRYGTTDIYHPGEYMIWTDGGVYRCLRDTNFSPEEVPADWEKRETPPEPGEAGPAGKGGGDEAPGESGAAGFDRGGIPDGGTSPSDT